ncbi:MAG: hypothetical protein P0Y59_02660 [Candidatus Sphingomonas phytovorans]|nr:hypothetical protein [Sphingomonas sp.]WEK00613.1 MAG: hypothetical protein P0Y59_02660 [Sphingomonas sp.]
MRLPTIALALSTLCSTSCADREPVRAIPVVPDRARLDPCPKAFPSAPSLAPLAAFTLPDGRAVVLLDTVIARETATVHYIVQARGAWHECRSAVAYVQDWGARVSGGLPVPK